MTVCIAAIASGPIIFCAADRKITVGDMGYEPDASKIYPISNTIVLMPSGDLGQHARMVPRLQRQMAEWFEANPHSYPNVEDFADRYAKIFRDMRAQRWEETILQPLGLTGNNLYKSGLTSEAITSLTDKLSDNLMPYTSAIIAGIDPYGARIFIVQQGEAFEQTISGYAAIGDGKAHAETQFTRARHHPNADTTETLWLTYLAKRRSEASVTVGDKATDLTVIGPSLGNLTPLREDIFRALREQYDTFSAEESALMGSAQDALTSHVMRLQQAEQVAPSSDAGAITSHEHGQETAERKPGSHQSDSGQPSGKPANAA